MACGKDPGKNLRHACELVGKAAKDGATVICLPELFRSQYFCQSEDPDTFDLAEPIPGPSTTALRRCARKHGPSSSPPSSSAVRRPLPQYGRRHRCGRRDRRHLPQDAHPGRPALLREVLLHARRPRLPGHRHARTRTVGTLICWDQWYPEAARLTALQGRRHPVLPHRHRLASLREERSSATRQHDAWQTMQRAHAIANGVFVAAVNRVGHEGPKGGGIEFWGGTFVCRPLRRGARQGSARPRGDHRRRVRSCRCGGDPPQLALPARPAHRRLRRRYSSVTSTADAPHASPR